MKMPKNNYNDPIDIIEDQELLYQIAISDESIARRTSAIKRLNTIQYLIKIIEQLNYPKISIKNLIVKELQPHRYEYISKIIDKEINRNSAEVRNNVTPYSYYIYRLTENELRKAYSILDATIIKFPEFRYFTLSEISQLAFQTWSSIEKLITSYSESIIFSDVIPRLRNYESLIFLTSNQDLQLIFFNKISSLHYFDLIKYHPNPLIKLNAFKKIESFLEFENISKDKTIDLSYRKLADILLQLLKEKKINHDQLGYSTAIITTIKQKKLYTQLLERYQSKVPEIFAVLKNSFNDDFTKDPKPFTFKYDEKDIIKCFQCNTLNLKTRPNCLYCGNELSPKFIKNPFLLLFKKKSPNMDEDVDKTIFSLYFVIKVSVIPTILISRIGYLFMNYGFFRVIAYIFLCLGVVIFILSGLAVIIAFIYHTIRTIYNAVVDSKGKMFYQLFYRYVIINIPFLLIFVSLSLYSYFLSNCIVEMPSRERFVRNSVFEKRINSELKEYKISFSNVSEISNITNIIGKPWDYKTVYKYLIFEDSIHTIGKQNYFLLKENQALNIGKADYVIFFGGINYLQSNGFWDTYYKGKLISRENIKIPEQIMYVFEKKSNAVYFIRIKGNQNTGASADYKIFGKKRPDLYTIPSSTIDNLLGCKYRVLNFNEIKNKPEYDFIRFIKHF